MSELYHITVYYVRGIFLCFAMLVCLPLSSQNNVNQYEYDFDGKAKALVKEMAEAKSKGNDTEAIRTKLLRNELGQALMGRVNNILIIDSAIIEYNRLSELYKDFTITIQTNNDRFSSVCDNNSRRRRVLPIADEKGFTKLAESVRIGNDDWSSPVMLPEFANVSGQMNFPFLSADGRTLYYSAQKEGTLGGYDIFVSCFDEATGKFSEGVNLGFPFNSSSNDFLFTWDDVLHYGKFATDRNTPKGYVRVYTFVEADSLKQFVGTGQVSSDSLSNEQDQQRLNEIRRAINHKINGNKSVKTTDKFIITDDMVCSDDSEIKSPNARRIAAELRKQETILSDKAKLLENKRKAYHNAPSDQLRKEILSLENEVDKLETTITTMQKNIRQAEIKI